MKFLTVPFAIIFLAACGARSSDEDQVRALLAAAEIAVEERDASDVLEQVAGDYSDAQGFDRATLQNYLRGYFLANPRIELLVTVDDLEFPVAGLGRARIGLTALPAGDRVTLQVEFRKQDDKWLVSRADKIRG